MCATIDDGVAKTASGETFVFRPARSLTEGKAVTVGIRPEHFQRSGEGSGPTGTISIIEPTGGQTFLTMEVAGKPTVMTVSGDDMVPMGSTLTLFVLPQQVYVFDAETGHRISEN
ncbi:TOBE domain-containing protein [Devosia psychrophila]